MSVITPPPIKAREMLGGHDAQYDKGTGIGRIRYKPNEGLMNPVGTVLGGYLTAMLDDVAGLVTWYTCGKRPFATAQMSTFFLRSAALEDMLTGEAQVTSNGKRQAFIEARGKRESDNKTIASATLVQTFLD